MKRSDIGYVYLLIDELSNYLKIGVSIDVNTRLSGIQSSCPYEIYCIDSFICRNPYNEEALLHKKFDYLRHRGEWFKFDEDIIKEFALRTTTIRLIDEVDELPSTYIELFNNQCKYPSADPYNNYQKYLEDTWPRIKLSQSSKEKKLIKEYIFDFGKYQGQSITTVPRHYIEYCHQNSWNNKVKDACGKYLYKMGLLEENLV